VSDNVLELHNIIVEYDGRTVLDVPHLEIRRGGILTLLGENGSGKTTLLRLLGLLIRPQRGRVVFGGEEIDFADVGRLLKQRRRMAAVMQEPLLCRMSVRRNVALGLRFRGLPKPDIEKRVGAWLNRLQITHLADRPASKLSGGEAQRTSLARAMVLNPEILCLDEPFSALDAPTRQVQLQEFQEVLAGSGVTAVFATHDRGEAIALGDRVAVLVNGRLAQVGSTDTIFTYPETVEVAQFVGVDTLIPGQVVGREDGLLRVACGTVHLFAEGAMEPGDRVNVAVRPEAIALFAQDDPDAGLVHNAFTGKVTRLVPTETHYRVELDCGMSVVAVISRVRARELALEVGSRVCATFSSSAAHLIKHISD
jgi:tungstate transport system ATP-binding protein